MAKYRANTTIGYAHGKGMIPSQAVFDPAALEISDAVVKQMLGSKLVSPVVDSEPVTFGPVPASEPSKSKPPNAADSIKLVEAAETLEALDVLAKNEERKSVLDAIQKKRQALKPAE